MRYRMDGAAKMRYLMSSIGQIRRELHQFGILSMMLYFTLWIVISDIYNYDLILEDDNDSYQ
jgi:hypothetical protein